MKERINEFTGKPMPHPDTFSQKLKEKCERHRCHIIINCVMCGAPNCCPECCKEAFEEYNNALLPGEDEV